MAIARKEELIEIKLNLLNKGVAFATTSVLFSLSIKFIKFIR